MKALLSFIFVVILLLWIFAFAGMLQHGGKRAVFRFLLNLVAVFCLGVLLYYLMIYPTLGCEGFFCAFGARFLYLLIMALLLIIMPVWMMAVTIRRYKVRNGK